jgi:hypothetical protein
MEIQMPVALEKRDLEQKMALENEKRDRGAEIFLK